MRIKDGDKKKMNRKFMETVKANEELIIVIVIMLFIGVMILLNIQFPSAPTNEQNNSNQTDWDSKTKNYCSPESRNAEVCITLYKPVCGWFNQSIQCIRYPCAATYSNECFACADPKVEYWTEGECPK